MDAIVEDIRVNYQRVIEQVAQAAQSAGRDPNEVRVVVVTKAQPVKVVRAAIEAGARLIGENYPEETQPKIQALGKPHDVAWHMIGHLQSRKAGIVAESFDMLQSLDSVRLAARLERLLSERGRVLPVLLEFNVGGEESKSGWMAADERQWDSLLPEVEQILAFEHLSVRGLMTMPPLADDPTISRGYFAKLRKLRDFLAARFSNASWQELSMGTSADFVYAVQEGATLVRVGTAVVGPRPKRGI